MIRVRDNIGLFMALRTNAHFDDRANTRTSFCKTLGTFGDKNVERKRYTYDVPLTSLTGACPIDAFEPRQIDVKPTSAVSPSTAFSLNAFHGL